MADAPVYRNEAGEIEGAVGVIIVNPDGSFASGGGGGVSSTITSPVGPGTAAAAVRTTEASDSPLLSRLPAALGGTTSANSLPVVLSSDGPFATQTGPITETAPASDTASSGLNGRLQRVAQRLTSLIALLPTALGGTTSANSLPVVLSSDGPFALQTGAVTETAPTTDTASSGLNGRLQRIAQRLSSLLGATFTDASISSAAGSSETVAAASATRTVLNVANPGTTTWWINESGGTAAANAAGCFELPPGARWTPRPAPTNIVKGIGTTASKLTVVTG